MTYSLDSSVIDREFLLQIDLNLFLLAILTSFFVGMYSAASYSLDRPIVVSVAAPLLLFTTAVVGNLLSIALSDPLLFVSNILNPENILAFDSEIQERVVISAAAAILVVGIQTIIWPGWEKSPYEREQERLPVRIPIDPFINRELLLDVRNILIRYNNSVDPDDYNDWFSNDPPYDVSVIEPVEGMTQQEVLEITDNETRRSWSKRYRRAINETNYEKYGKEAIYLEMKVVREAEEEQKEWRAQIFLKLKKWTNRVREKIRTKWG